MKQSEINKIHPKWKVVAFCNDFTEVVNCCNCGKAIMFDDGYTSRNHFTDNELFGLIECGTCYFSKERSHE